MKIVLFEDSKYNNFYPISRMHSVGEIRTGRYTQKERAIREFGAQVMLYSGREGFGDPIEKSNDTLFLNARLKEFRGVGDLEYGSCIINEGELIAYHFDKILSEVEIEKLSIIERDFPLYEFIWDILEDLESRLTEDLKEESSMGQILSPIDESAHIENRDMIFIGKDVKIENCVFLDASKGPIYIDNYSIIRANTVIEGPAYIGEGCLIKCGSFLNTVAIGKVTKLSGEIEESIFQGYANKQHFGFLGHSYIGEWVNLGAGTTNSDLKNNYSAIRVYPEGREYKTGMQFLGLIMGDHCKTAINTSFNTGTIVGPFSNIFGRDFPPKYLPPFSWWGGDFKEYSLEKAIKTARIVMMRRDIKMDDAYLERIKQLFLTTKGLREKVNKGGNFGAEVL
jgi:UDP-N-acetylglucosamine diphosphorylase/glucosamine-1-phosphate N-acetyltransferase